MAKRKDKMVTAPIAGRCRSCGAEFRSGYALKKHRYICPNEEGGNAPRNH